MKTIRSQSISFRHDLILFWTKFLLIAASLLLLSQPLRAETVINVTSYGATGGDTTDDTAAVQAAFNAASAQSQAEGGSMVRVRFPAGRYYLKTGGGMLVPSNLILSGDAAGESIVLGQPSGGGLFTFSTKNFSQKYSYMAVARADDPSHPAVPNNDYTGLNYVYLKDPADIAILRGLGIPASVTTSYGGIKAQVASGATLSNNHGISGVPPGSSPKVTLEGEDGVNPTPSNLNTILAVQDNGKVFLKEGNRLNWGVDAHKPNELLSDYYSPTAAYSSQNIISGPAWIVPANNYHHDIRFENLIFETDPTESSRIRYASSLLLGYAYNVAVKNCLFRNTPGFYHILACRSFNNLIENNRFTVYNEQSVTLDAGSGYYITGNTFTSASWPNGTSIGIPASAVNYLTFDEEPIDITIYKNQFDPLTYQSAFSKSGKAIFGPGGAFLKMVDNNFVGIPKAIVETAFFTDDGIIDGNRMNGCAGWFNASGARLSFFNNRYDTTVPIGVTWTAFNSYNYKGDPANYFCANYGITMQPWHYPITYLAANYKQDGTPINQVTLINVNEVVGQYGTVSGTNPLNPLSLTSISFSKPSLGIEEKTSVTVALSGTTASAYPFYLVASGGEGDAAWIENIWFEVPAGSQSVTLPDTIQALREGTVTVSARPLAATTPHSVSTTLTVSSSKAPTVDLTAPISGDTFVAPATIALTADATTGQGTISRVDFFAGSTKIGSSTSAPYSCAWNNVAAGNYVLTAKAVDSRGLEAVSEASGITVTAPINQKPSIVLVTPSGGSTFISPAAINMTADAVDADGSITKVEFYENGIKVGEKSATPYSYTWNCTYSGTYNLSAQATDDDGATSTCGPIQVVVKANQSPSASITSPSDGAQFTAPATINVSATATDSDGSISKVEFYSNGTKIGEKSASPYTLALSSIPAGSYALTIKATDDRGAVSTSSAVNVKVNPSIITGSGTGLEGNYFSDRHLNTRQFKRTDPTINFNWETGSPDPRIPSDRFSIRWKGKIQPRYSETYTFHIAADDGVRLWIDGVQIINAWYYFGTGEVTASVPLTAGKLHDIQLDYYEGVSGARVKFSWASPSQSKEVVPSTQLYLPTASTPTPPTGSGLRGEYYDDQFLSHLQLTRVDSKLDFNWDLGSPASTLPADHFSVRWSGKILPQYSQTYTFHASGDDGMRLWINNQPVIDAWYYFGTGAMTGSITLQAGVYYDIRLEYYEGVSGARAKLEWSSPSQAKEVIPTTRLFLPTP
jgi:hypothetical protein